MASVVLMGVAGCGKTTVGRALAAALHCEFVDGDDVHPPANIQRMQRGEALTDAHRWPWLDALHDRLHDAERRGTTLVVACSALRCAYRERLFAGLGKGLAVLLQIDRAAAALRLEQRTGHFFGPTLLASQFDTLEPLVDGAAVAGSGARSMVVDATQPTGSIVQQILLRRGSA